MRVWFWTAALIAIPGVLRADPPLPVAFTRTQGGVWLALSYGSDGIRLWIAPDSLRPDRLAPGLHVVGSSGSPFVPMAEPVTSAAFCLDSANRIHITFGAGGRAFAIRSPIPSMAEKGAWRGPSGEAGPDLVAEGVTPRACAVVSGGMPIIAGTYGDRVVVLRREGGQWRTVVDEPGRDPALVRGAGRSLHLAYAGSRGICYCTAPDGEGWGPAETALVGAATSAPVLAIGTGAPLVATLVGGKACVAAREAGAWLPVSPQPEPQVGPWPPQLAVDRCGTVWCLWRADGWDWAARWLGTRLSPAVPLGPASAPLLAEQHTPDTAGDVTVMVSARDGAQVQRLPVPVLTALDDRPTRFLDLLELERVEGLVQEGARWAPGGVLPPPEQGEIRAGGIAPTGQRDGLRAWYAVRKGEHWTARASDWARSRWQPPARLQIAAASRRPWVQEPRGALVVIVDEEDPDGARRLKMAAESAGASAALLTSSDGLTWAFYSELPPIRPAALLRDPLAAADERWRVYGGPVGSGGWTILNSADRQHWRKAGGYPGLDVRSAALWAEDGLVLGILGARLVAGRTGGRLVPVADLPALVEGRLGQAFAPPIWWRGRRVLFLAAPDAWRWVDVPAGRWVALVASSHRPGVCVTVPVLLAASRGRRLFLDLGPGERHQRRPDILVEALDPSGDPVAGYVGRVRPSDGWCGVAWEGRRELWHLRMESVRLRITLPPGERLYGIRFASRR